MASRLIAVSVVSCPVVQHECDHLQGVLYPMRQVIPRRLVFTDVFSRCYCMTGTGINDLLQQAVAPPCQAGWLALQLYQQLLAQQARQSANLTLLAIAASNKPARAGRAYLHWRWN